MHTARKAKRRLESHLLCSATPNSIILPITSARKLIRRFCVLFLSANCSIIVLFCFYMYHPLSPIPSFYFTNHSPVLLSSQHTHITKSSQESNGCQPESSSHDDLGEHVLQVMKWGLIPSWHKGKANSYPALLNNCRSEGMMEKPSFRNAIQKRQRCVVLADGSVMMPFYSVF